MMPDKQTVQKNEPVVPFRVDDAGRFSMLRIHKRLYCVCGYQIGTGGSGGAWLFRSVAIMFYKNQFHIRCPECKKITTLTANRKPLANL